MRPYRIPDDSEVTHMNPSNPTTTEMRLIEQLFLHQMRALSRRTACPSATGTFDFQCSDRWL
jgi:hypothetical protein